tara:strand:+ start:8948 stop:9295 length:348 start_codon:yes stop_codon:yes gene_type:complete
MSQLLQLADFIPLGKGRPKTTYFSRDELNILLNLYSRRVSTGEWRDYAIDHGAGVALFSVFRHTHDLPLYTIAKRSGGKGRNDSDFQLFSGRQRLLGKKNLKDIIIYLEKKLRLI